MEINFIAVLEDSQTIKIYDYSETPVTTPFDIYRMTLQIKSSIIPGGKLSSPVDLLAYIKSQRQEDEIYTIKSDLLGVGESKDIPDGIYTLEYIINDIYRKDQTIVVYQAIKAEVEALLAEVNYGIEVGDYDVTYVGDYSDVDLEKVRLAVALLDEIEDNASVKNVSKVQDALNKLKRLLLLINI